MEDEIPLTFAEKALEFAIAVPDTPVFQFSAGFTASLVICGLLLFLSSRKPQGGGRSRHVIRNKDRVKLSGEELRSVRAQRRARSNGDVA